MHKKVSEYEIFTKYGNSLAIKKKRVIAPFLMIYFVLPKFYTKRLNHRYFNFVGKIR